MTGCYTLYSGNMLNDAIFIRFRKAGELGEGGGGGGRQETSYQRPAEKPAGSFSGRRKKGAGGERQCLTGEGKGTIINGKKF